MANIYLASNQGSTIYKNGVGTFNNTGTTTYVRLDEVTTITDNDLTNIVGTTFLRADGRGKTVYTASERSIISPK